MATAYNLTLRDKRSRSNEGGMRSDQKGDGVASDKDIFSGHRNGVDNNTKLRAINPFLDKITGGKWEKGVRAARAVSSMESAYESKGMKGIIGGTGMMVAIQIILVAVMREVDKYWTSQKELAEKSNKQDFLNMENGVSQIYGSYETTTNILTGKLTIGDNK